MTVGVRPVCESDIDSVERHLSPRKSDKHRRRLAAQQEGTALYLVAWSGRRPVGHAFVRWDGSSQKAIASRLRACPEIDDLYVAPDLRSRGIGAKLLAAAEEAARARGYARIGLGVAIDNPRARALYERTGYLDSGLGEYRDFQTTLDGRGNLRTHDEVCEYRVKELGAGATPSQ